MKNSTSFLYFLLSTCLFISETSGQLKKYADFKDDSGVLSTAAADIANNYVAAGNEIGILTVWDLKSKEELFKARPHKEKIRFIKFVDSKKSVLTADSKSIILTSLEDGTEKDAINIFEDIESLEFSPDGVTLIVKATRRNIPTSENTYTINIDTRKYDVYSEVNRGSKYSFSPDGKLLYIVDGNEFVIHDVQLQIDKKILKNDSKITSIDPDYYQEDWLLTTDRYSAKYWQLSSGKKIPYHWNSVFKNDESAVRIDQAWILTDNQILMKSSEGLKMKDPKKMKESEIFPINPLRKVSVSADKKFVFGMGYSGSLEVWQNMAIEEVVEPEPVVIEEVEEVPEPVELSDDEKAYALYKEEIDAELSLKSALFAPRGEFERSSEYTDRQAKADAYKASIMAYYKDKMIRAQNVEKQMEIAKKRYLDSLERMDEQRRMELYKGTIRDSYKEYTTKIQGIGTYDADKEYFPIIIDGQTENVSVPIDKARSFKNNYEFVKVVGARQLKDDAKTLEVFNLKIIDPSDDSVYDFGLQKEPAFVEPAKRGVLLSSLLKPAIPEPKPKPQVTPAKEAVSANSNTEDTANKRPTLEQRMVDHLMSKDYHALIIGVNDYMDESISKLDEPINDALKLKNVLQEQYTFEEENIMLLENPTRSDIIESFDELAQKVKKDDNLLIFYAGHGVYDERLKQGYWLPRDAKQSTKSAWLSNGTIRDYIGGIKSKHTLLIADACFSGGIFKTRDVFMKTRAILELYKLPSRKAITSGNMKTVPDKSVFMEYLIKRLNESEQKMISAEQLFSSFRVAVINNSANGQVPQFGDIRETGDEGGDFVFLKR